MPEQMCVNITLDKTKMDLIAKRANELGVSTGALASFLLDRGVGVGALPKVRVSDPPLYLSD